MIKLSIIIPYYNCKEYTDELLSCLNKQITDEVEVILIDDGSKISYSTKYEWVKIIRQKNGGASVARNTGLDNATGEYIAFIDADDMVAENYISAILDKIAEEEFDYCYLSWKTLPGGWDCQVKLRTIDDKFPPFNLCCWNRIYKKSMIGNVRFNKHKLIAEDAEFIRDVKEDGKKKAFISEYLYFYRSNVTDSLTKRFARGELDTKRIVIHYKHITSDMKDILDQAKELNKTGEVIILTEKNEIPELEKYAMVMKPSKVKGTQFIGEPTPYFEKIACPIRTQVVIWTDTTFNIGGIETFIYSFCKNLYKKYDIMVLYNKIGSDQLKRLQEFVRVEHIDLKKKIICDTIIVNRITDKIPQNIEYQQSIQMVHACRLMKEWHVPMNLDHIVAVSNVVKDSYLETKDNEKCQVINNLTCNEPVKKALRLISATRLTFEKGGDRISKFAIMLKKNNIPFVWTIFTDHKMNTNIEGLVQMQPTLDIKSYIASSDYLVQFSDSEGFCYSIVEALEMGIPVLTTPIDVLDELGFVDGKHGYILPFEMNEEDIDLDKIQQGVPEFKYSANTRKKIKQWQDLLGDSTPVGDYKYTPKTTVSISIIKPYKSLALHRNVKKDEKFEVSPERAEALVQAKVAKILG